MFTRADLYDAVYSYKDYRLESERVRELITKHSRSAGTRLLDVACGTGKHLAVLREWYRTEGLDLSERLLAAAAERCPDTPLHGGDMRTFDLGEQFDAVVCLFASIGYMTTIEDLALAANRMAAHLVPGGVLLVEPFLHEDEVVEGRVVGQMTDGEQFKVARFGVPRREGRIFVWDMHYLVASPEGVEHLVEPHRLGLFSREEYLQALADAGLEASFDENGVRGRGTYIGVKPG